MLLPAKLPQCPVSQLEIPATDKQQNTEKFEVREGSYIAPKSLVECGCACLSKGSSKAGHEETWGGAGLHLVPLLALTPRTNPDVEEVCSKQRNPWN
jgi:hypothetical protein